MNPIQQAINVLERVVRGDTVYESGLDALTSLRSLQKEVEGVLQEPRAWMMEWPQHSPSFTTDKSDYVSWEFGKAHYPEALQGLYTADQLRTAIAAALGREAGRPDPLEKLTRMSEDMGLYDEATQPTQAEAAREREALELAQEALGWHVARCGEDSVPDVTVEALTAISAALATQQAVQGEPVATLYVSMETHDMGQSLAPNPPFKFAQAKAHQQAKDLPVGEYALYTTTPPVTVQGEAVGEGKRLHDRLIKEISNLLDAHGKPEKWGCVGPSEEDIAWGRVTELVDHICIGLDSPPAPQQPESKGQP